MEEAQRKPCRSLGDTELPVRATKTSDGFPWLLPVGREGKWISTCHARSSGIKEQVEFLRIPVEGEGVI